MKKALIFLAVIGLAGSLGAQSLVELAKREKERRESFRGRHAVVVKNSDLLLVKRVAAVEVSNPGAVAGGDRQAADQGTGGTDVTGDSGPVTPPSGSKAASGSVLMEDNAEDDPAEGGGPLEEQLKAADEVVEKLTTEMNALLRQYEAQNTMVPGSIIQEQIEETNQRLVRAQTRQSKLRAKMEKKGIAPKKDPGSVDR